MTSPQADDSALEEALERLASAGPELANGNSNHAPMAIEAMCALGRADAVPRWLDRYRTGLLPRPAATERITKGSWPAALGRVARATDWFQFFENELEERPWREVLDRWTARLAPGIVAAAFHGVIRAGHAVRSLADADTIARRRELADGLAYWAAEYRGLPSDHASRAPALPSAAIARVAMIAEAERPASSSLTGALGQLDSFAPFRATLRAVGPVTDPGAFLSDLCATFAGVYQSHARDLLTTIAFIHTVTGPSALRPMLPHLGAETARSAVLHAWQACAALYATFGADRPKPRTIDAAPPDTADLVERAIACGDEHAIKFTEVCLREDRHSPNPAFRAASEHAVQTLAAQS